LSDELIISEKITIEEIKEIKRM